MIIDLVKKREVILAGIFLILFFLLNIVSAEKLSLQIEKLQNDAVSFKAIVYDDNNNKLNGEAKYVIQDYYTDVMGEGRINSGEEVKFKLPKNPSQGPWKINVSYKDKSVAEFFNVGEIKRADIRLENDNLIIENTGNVVYGNNLLIAIGDGYQTEKVYLAIGGMRKLRLTAPAGEYTVKVDDGSREKNIVFSGVSLTGNAIGLENVIEGNYWKRYPEVIVFLVIVFASVIVLTFKLRKKDSGNLKKGKKK